MEALKFIFIGAAVGVANVIPGVSGGTMAVVFGIYDRIVSCTKKENLKKNIWFLVEVIVGAALGIVLFSKAVKFLCANYAVATTLTFFGLILGSIPMIFRNAREYYEQKKSTKTGVICGVCFAATLGIMILMTIFNQNEISDGQSMAMSPMTLFLMFVAGIIAAVAMILPGISGSLMMVIMGLYTTVISAIGGLTEFSKFGTPEYMNCFYLLIPFGIGCLVGLVGGLNVVRILLEKTPAPMYFAILGLVVGSLLTVFPFGDIALNAELAIGAVLTLAAAVAAYLFSRPKKKNA